GQRRAVLLTLSRTVAVHTRQVEQHGEACCAFHERADRRTAETQDKIAFPVAGHGAILRLSRTLADQKFATDKRLAPALGTRPRHSQCSPCAQTRRELAPQRASALDVKRLVDGFVADSHRRIIREVERQTL